MGFVTLGFFLIFGILEHTESTRGAALGIEGGMMPIISHGFISGALFLCVGVLYDCLHSRQIADYGGLVNTMPRFGSFMVLFAMVNAGLAGTSGFVGEFMVILSSVKASFGIALLAGLTLVLDAAYNPVADQAVDFWRHRQRRGAGLADINRREGLELLELLSLSLYALVAFNRDSPVSAEAAMKYFVLGALASGMLLYGIAMIYGATGSLHLDAVTAAIAGQEGGSLVLAFGLVFLVVGLAFKLGAVPFHMWVPDVYTLRRHNL